MINGKLHRDIILEILIDCKPHFAREFLNAGLCEYRQPIDQLRKRGYVIKPLTIADRPAWQITSFPMMTEATGQKVFA